MPNVAQYSLGKWITLLAKYSGISSSGKSVCSIALCAVNTKAARRVPYPGYAVLVNGAPRRLPFSR